MRSLIAALPLLALTACGGASGPESVGSSAPPAGGGSTGGSGASGGTGGGIGTGGTGGGTSTPAPTQTHFLDIADETSFSAIGAFQSLLVNETGVQGSEGPKLYAGNAATVRAPSGTITFSPRDGIFTVNFADSKAGITTGILRFQDPAFRSADPLWGVPSNLTDFNFLEARGGTARTENFSLTPIDYGREDQITFFYQRPGSKTNYVSLAGYSRSQYDKTANRVVFKAQTSTIFDRGAMVFGTQTQRSQVPITGTADYNGGLLATMVVNTNATGNDRLPSYFQWITGSADLKIDFSRATMSMLLTGTALPVVYAGVTLGDNATAIAGGTSFRAEGGGTIDLTATGGFTGNFSSVCFGCAAGDDPAKRFVVVDQRVNPNNSNAGANSIDGTFFGPNAVNVGGNFRIVGGVPDQRVDILGAFTGAKK